MAFPARASEVLISVETIFIFAIAKAVMLTMFSLFFNCALLVFLFFKINHFLQD